MGKVEKTRFERNWTTSSTQLFALFGKAHPKWWYETDFMEFDPMGVYSLGPDGESRKNAFWTQLDDRRKPGFCAAWKSPTRMVVWNRPRGIRSHGCLFASPWFWNSKKRVLNEIGRPSSTRLFALLGKPQKMVVWNRFATMGKVEKTSFERNWRTFVNPAFCAAWKSPPIMVVWNRARGIWSQGCFFVSPRWAKSKKRALNAIGRLSSTRLFALLGKAHPFGGMKPTS